MILMLANPLLELLKGGGGPENLDFLGFQSNGFRFHVAISGPKKVSMINIS
jgi:hypothetical protein